MSKSIKNKNTILFPDGTNHYDCMKKKVIMLIDCLCEDDDNYSKFNLNSEEIINYYFEHHLNDAFNLFKERIANGWLNEHLDFFIADDCIIVCGIEETFDLFISKKQLLNTNNKKIQLSESVKKQIAGKQRYKCANKPNTKLKYLSDYYCPLWRNLGDGSFDEAGYEIDHITELAVGGGHNLDNLQALCQSCHKLKTKRFINKLIV